MSPTPLPLRLLRLALVSAPLLPASTFAAQELGVDEPLVVAVREVPPFAMKDVAGNWDGLSIALWQDVADRLDLDFDWRELGLAETLAGLEDGSVDVGAVALTISKEREERFDFTHPYHVGGLTLGFRAGGGSGWLATLRGFLSLEFLTAVGSLAVVLLIAGFAVWLFERRGNAEEFGEGDVARGLGDGFWWSAVTMTTVGYGDKAPKTLGGRVVGLIWMFASLIIVASFTASIAASLTANRLESDLLKGRGLDELVVGVLEGSTAEDLAEARGARTRSFASVDAALASLGSGGLDAVLHDEPVLAYLARTEHDWLELAPRPIVRDDYGFALQAGSPLRKPVNTALLSILPEPVWQDVLRRYLGSPSD